MGLLEELKRAREALGGPIGNPEAPADILKVREGVRRGFEAARNLPQGITALDQQRLEQAAIESARREAEAQAMQQAQKRAAEIEQIHQQTRTYLDQYESALKARTDWDEQRKLSGLDYINQLRVKADSARLDQLKSIGGDRVIALRDQLRRQGKALKGWDKDAYAGIQAGTESLLQSPGSYLGAIFDDPGYAAAMFAGGAAANSAEEYDKQRLAQQAAGEKADAEAKNKPWYQWALDATNWGAENFLNRPFNAWQLANRSGVDPWDQLGAGFAALPGLGSHVGNENTRSWVDAVDSEEKRAGLQAQGRLKSPGETLGPIVDFASQPIVPGVIKQATGRDVGLVDVGRGEIASWVPTIEAGGYKFGGGMRTSALYDAALNVAFDPLTYTPLVTGKLAKVGEVSSKLGRARAAASAAEEAGSGFFGRAGAAANASSYLGEDLARVAGQAGREGFLGGRRGASMLAGLERPILNAKSATELARMTGLPGDIAQDVLKARNFKGLAAAKEAAAKAFTSGEFNPSITLRRQALAQLPGVGERAVGAKGIPLLLGEKTFKARPYGLTRTGLTKLRERGITSAPFVHGDAVTAVKQRLATYSSLKRGERIGTLPDLWDAKVRPTVEGKTIEERFALLGESSNPALLAEADASLHEIRKLNPASTRGRLAAEQVLRDLEGLAATLDGAAGPRAARMAEAELTTRVRTLGGDFKSAVERGLTATGATRGTEHIQGGLARVAENLDAVAAQVDEVKTQLGRLADQADDDLLPDGRRVAEAKAGLGQRLDDLEAKAKEFKAERTSMKRDVSPYARRDKGLGHIVSPLADVAPRSLEEITNDLDALKTAVADRRKELKAGLGKQKQQAMKELDHIIESFDSEIGSIETRLSKLGREYQELLKRPSSRERTLAMEANRGDRAILKDDLRVLKDRRADFNTTRKGVWKNEFAANPEYANLKGEYELLERGGTPDPGVVEKQLDTIEKKYKEAKSRELKRLDGLIGDRPGASNGLPSRNAGLREERKALFLGEKETAEMRALREEADRVRGFSQRPRALDDFELQRLVAKSGASEEYILKLNRMSLEQIERNLEAARVNLDDMLRNGEYGGGDPFFTGYRPTSDALGTPRAEPPHKTFARIGRFQEDLETYARNIILYEDMLARVDDVRHPLLDEIERVKAEWADRTNKVIDKNSAENLAAIDRDYEYARKYAGALDGKPLPNTKQNREYLRQRAIFIEDEALRKEFLTAVDEAKDGKFLTKLAGQVEKLIRDKDVADAAAWFIDIDKKNAAAKVAEAERAIAAKRGGLGKRFAAGVANLPLSVMEEVAPRVIRFQSSPNRIQEVKNLSEDIQRWSRALGFDEVTTQEFVQAATQVRTEEELYRLIKEAYVVYADRAGVDADVILSLGASRYGEHADTAFTLDAVKTKTSKVTGKEKLVDAELVGDVQLVTQKRNNIPILHPEEMRTAVRQAKAEGGQGVEKAGAVFRRGFTKAGGVELPLTHTTLKETAEKAHRFWKFAAVTNAPFIPIGFAGGFLTGDDLQDRVKRGFAYGAIGALGSARYLGRVVGVEERLIRYNLIRGISPVEWIPGIAKAERHSGVNFRFRLMDDLASGANPIHHLQDQIFVATSHEWRALGQNNKNFVEGWWRIVNHHVMPETDDLARMTLQGKLGLIGGEDGWEKLAIDWLTNDDDGKILLSRLKGANGGPKDAAEAVERYTTFIDTYLPTDDLKRLRLSAADDPNGEVEHALLKDLLKRGEAPKAIYAQETWLFPKPWEVSKWKQTWDQVYSRIVFDAPTAKVNRIPLAESLYKDDYLAYVKNGVPEERARELAEVTALQKTNEVMFRVSDESRFAAKADYIFPFQQPREELVRVYGKLAVENPAHLAQFTKLAAQTFNNGARAGVFFEDQYGEWRMKVPGSAELSALFGSPTDNMDFRLKDAFFFLQGGGYAVGGTAPEEAPVNLLKSSLPVPGGPMWTFASQLALESHTWVKEEYGKAGQEAWWWKLMFPYGSEGNMFRKEGRLLWYNIFNSPFPGEIFNREGPGSPDEEIKKHASDVIRQLQWQHYQQTGNNDYFPTPEEVKESLKGLFTVWGIVGGITPAPLRPNYPGYTHFTEVFENVKKEFGDRAVEVMFTRYPEMAGMYLRGRTASNDTPFDKWLEKSQRSDFNGVYDRDFARYLTYDEFKAEFEHGRKVSKAWDEFHQVLDGVYATPEERMLEIELFLKRAKDQYPDVDFKHSYFKKKELQRILTQVPDGAHKNDLLNMWRRAYDVSPQEFNSLKAEVKDWESNVWVEAREMSTIVDLAREVRLKGDNEYVWVQTSLSPAEQIKYWQAQLLDNAYYPTLGLGDNTWKTGAFGERDYSDDVVDRYKRYKTEISMVWARYGDVLSKKEKPQLRWADELQWGEAENGFKWQNGKPDGQWSVLSEAAQKHTDIQVQGVYDQINALSARKDAAAKAKRWSEYYALKAQVSELYKLRNTLTENLANLGLVDWDEKKHDIMALTVLIADPNANPDFVRRQKEAFARKNELIGGHDAYLLTTGYEDDYRNMPAQVRTAYVNDLYTRLNSTYNTDTDEVTAMRWNYLTPFQQRLMEKVFPDQVDAWKHADANFDSSGRRKGGRRFRRYKRYRRYGRGSAYYKSEAGAAINYAYSLMKLNNKRPPGAKAPAAYAEYIALPGDPGTRHKFLREHPEVRDWIAQGPLANMSELDRAITTNILIKYGKWEGEPLDDTAVNEIAFAREQLHRWTKRPEGELPPETYDQWVAMPTGVEKADFLKSHPEVQQWVKDGPMANMPPEYQDVVRDIMQRYQLWTAKQDPLSQTMSEFYATPTYMRKKFISDHPELAAYWTAIRTPEENALYNLSEQYFGIQDPRARRMFMAAHPELTDHFNKQRTRRYEQFLNRVAVYMGQNPEMFDSYLMKQNAIMEELVRKFGSTPIISERPMGVTKGAELTRRSEGVKRNSDA